MTDFVCIILYSQYILWGVRMSYILIRKTNKAMVKVPIVYAYFEKCSHRVPVSPARRIFRIFMLIYFSTVAARI